MDFTNIDGWATMTLIAATVTTGLMAGIYFAFSCAVMLGLAGTSDAAFIDTMQQINQKILNIWFLAVFLGSVALPAVAAVLTGIDGDTGVLRWAIAATIFAIVSFGITVGRNVPLNNALDNAGRVESISDVPQVREAFEEPWVRWNLYRTIASTLALVTLVRAVMLHS